MFNKKLISKLLNLEKDQLVSTADSKYVLYRFDRGSKHEFRLETKYITLERFYLEKNLLVEKRLINILKDMGKFEGEV